MKENYSVVRIKTSTLNRIKKIAKEKNVSVPKILDGLLAYFELNAMKREDK